MAHPAAFSRACKAPVWPSLRAECRNHRIHLRVSSRFAQQRQLITVSPNDSAKPPDFAFVFDIDGVLLRSHDPIPRAREALTFLQSQKIPFILLTNGGGKHESERVEEVSKKLHVPLNTSLFVQSHSPFADMEQFKDKTVMVVGGVEDKCRKVAERYGYKTVVTPADVFVQHPSIWPFSLPFLDYYRPFTRPLPQPIDPSDPTKTLKIDGIFVYNDPRDWGLDAAIIIDLLLSSGGKLGTISAKNNNPNLPNRGYQQDGQPPLYFCNPDLWWATNYHLSRLGQGAFRESLEGIWAAVTGGEKKGVVLNKEVIGKPFPKTFEFAEKKLIQHRKNLFQDPKLPSLKRVFMVGDNPESDIRGGNTYKSPHGVSWSTVLVNTGVYGGGVPAWEPTTNVPDVYDAVRWVLTKEQWHSLPPR